HNAAKYTPKGGHIDVKVKRLKGEVLVAVRDNGIGIAKEMLPKVFDLFVQAEHGLDRSQGGLGIGLTLVKRLVALHGGQVSVKSDGLGHGSEFTVRLSAPSEEEARSDDYSITALPGSESAMPVRILVVDDNADIAQSMAIMLESLGHDVRVAPDGVCALAEA